MRVDEVTFNAANKQSRVFIQDNFKATRAKQSSRKLVSQPQTHITVLSFTDFHIVVETR